jgi:hypothetical protein
MVKRRRGNRIEFTRVDFSTRQESVLFDEPAAAFGNVTCSPDGRLIVYRASQTGLRVRESRPAVTPRDIRLPIPMPTSSGFPISPDGRQIAFFGRRQDDPSESLFAIDVDGDRLRQLVRLTSNQQFMNTWGIAWSADSRHVYFSRRQNTDASEFSIFRISAEGGTEQAIGLDGRDLRDLNVSADGRRIAFSVGPLNRLQIWAVAPAVR